MQQKMKSENLLADAANATNSEVKEANPQLVSPTASEKNQLTQMYAHHLLTNQARQSQVHH